MNITLQRKRNITHKQTILLFAKRPRICILLLMTFRLPTTINHQQAVEILHEIEQRFPVNDLYFGEVQAWAFIRIQLWHQLKNPTLPILGWESKTDTLNSPSRWTNFKTFGRRLQAYLPTRWAMRQSMSQLPEARVDTLIYATHSYYTDFIGDQAYHRILDPLMYLLPDKTLKFELQPEAPLNQVHPSVYLQLDDFRARRGFMELLPFGSDEQMIEGLDDFRALVQELTGRDWIREHYWRHFFLDVLAYAERFSQVLNKFRPKALFMTNYYGMVQMALLWAANRMGITTVDVQHGKQGQYHGAYTHWSQIPAGGYEALPDYFWVWGEETRENINRHHNRPDEVHIPLVGGNRWLAKWANGAMTHQPTEATRSFYERIDKAEKVILVTLQPIEDFLPNELVLAIAESPLKWLWLIRTHPIHKDMKGDAQAILDAHGIVNTRYDIDHSTDEPLYALLQKTDVHITCWSSTGYEALRFGVPTVLVDELAETLYTDYIAQSLFVLALENESILEAIREAKSLPDEPRPYIETDDAKAEQALQRIYNR